MDAGIILAPFPGVVKPGAITSPSSESGVIERVHIFKALWILTYSVILLQLKEWLPRSSCQSS